MKDTKVFYLILIAITLAVYYVVVGIIVHNAGYFNHESLFYTEKSRIIFEGIGDRLKTIGLTSPILPFYGMLPYALINELVAPVVASAIGTAALFLVIGIGINKRTKDDFFLIILLILFLFHPGIIYAACSGKGIYIILIFFFLFFYNIFRFYDSNTTFHVSISSILLVVLVFCDYKFIWITIFFIPLVISIAIQSMNLSEKQSIFRLTQSFNNPSLRRKLVNKTLAIYVIIFILPLICVMCYKILNQTHANDFDYFNNNAYATWGVLVDDLENNLTPIVSNYSLKEVTFLTSVRAIIYCPLILLAIFLFRKNMQHLLTMLIPFGFIEFLKIEYQHSFLTAQYYLIFVVMSLLVIVFNSAIISRNKIYKGIILVLVVFQVYTGYHYLLNSYIESERDFVLTFEHKNSYVNTFEDYRDIAAVIDRLPKNEYVLVDDANAYGVTAFVRNIHKLILPYQLTFLSAIENPSKYVDYVLVASDTNPVAGYTQLNSKYRQFMLIRNGIKMDKVYETDGWTLYKLLNRNND